MDQNLTIIKVSLTSNNTIVTILVDNKTFTTLSCGKIGFKGSKRSTTYSNQKLGETVSQIIRQKKLTNIVLCFKGFNKNRRSVLKGLKKQNIFLKKIIDITSAPHNGCRPKKQRRR